MADIEVTETTQRISEGEITITLQNKEESVINVYSKQFVKKGSYESVFAIDYQRYKKISVQK